MLALHDCRDSLFGAFAFKILLAKREESCEFAQIIACDSLHSIDVTINDTVLWQLQDINQNVNALQVVCLIEEDE